MKIFLSIIIISCSFLVGIQNETKFKFNAPPEWKKETIKFPLDFAPEIDYQGFEELRFAPGMFDPHADSYFTYTFFWCLKGERKITPEALADNLTRYFKGLCRAVGNGRGLNIDLEKIKAEVENYSAHDKRYKNMYHAKIATFDPFNKGEAISLNLEIALLDNKKPDQTVMIFCVSPKGFPESVWKQLREIRDSFEIS